MHRWIVPLTALLLAGPAQAQGIARDYAEALVELTAPRWKGQVVDWPTPQPRPEGMAYVLRSSRRSVAVHAAPGVGVEQAEQALEALEAAQELLDAAGWPSPYPDGGRGGTGEFDLYLETGAGKGADAFADAPVPWSLYDAVTSFAVVDPTVARGALPTCVASAYAQAMLLGQDPAEARAWREATGAFAAWLVTGVLDCEGSVATWQQNPSRTWIGDHEPNVEPSGGALMLTLLSARRDGGTGVFVRELWQLARQRSGDLTGLRGSPDLWQALEADLDAAGGRLEDTMQALALRRYFAGRRENADTPWPLRGLGPHATVPVRFQLDWAALPVRTRPADPPLEPYGTAYARVDVTEAPDDALLRVWLRGEYGVQWSLVAVRLDAEGRELQRVTAPSRKIPRSYLPVQLDADTARVLLVVTNLSSRIPDADTPDENVRSFTLILDHGTSDTALGPG
ncbi:MAG: hypothetical protein ACODAG_07205 [Myxococcota bacterium]